MIEALKAILFGIVEGITEWLPISSTGHMMLLNQFVSLDVSDAFYDTFLVVVQLGAIMAVIILFFGRLNPFASFKTPEEKKGTWRIWAKVAIGSIPAAIVGFTLDDYIEEHIVNNSDIAYIVVSGALILYGVVFIIIELRNRRLLEQSRVMHGKHVKQSETKFSVKHIDMHPRLKSDKSASFDETDASTCVSKVKTIDDLSY
ncbi:MAG: undecaprenyl-diphosphate phosphatase, partial [Eggerthellaceae bacterium]|nr:undecaprenyl-diphosphate phosphatase [Eggerthellaceae bacterium]